MTEPLSEQLKQWRLARGLSLRGLALRAGVGKSALSDWEAGKHLPRLPELTAVLDALHVSAGEQRLLLAALKPTLPAESQEIVPVPVWGDLLRAIRVRQGRTQAEVASAVGVTQGRLARWERSEDWPAPERLERLCGVLQAQPEECTALLQGQFRLWEDLGEVSDAALQVYMTRHRFLAVPELLELHGVIWQRLAWEQYQKHPTTLPIVAWAYACHAYRSTIWHRGQTTLLPAQQAVQIYREILKQHALLYRSYRDRWMLAWESYGYALSVSSPQGNRHAVKMLNEVLPMASGMDRVNLLSGMAFYEMQQGAFDRALALDAEADRLEMRDASYFSTIGALGNYDRAHILLAAGRTREALSLLPASLDTVGTPFQRGEAARVWTAVCLENGAHRLAQSWLDCLKTLLTTEQLPHLQRSAETLETQLAQGK